MDFISGLAGEMKKTRRSPPYGVSCDFVVDCWKGQEERFPDDFLKGEVVWLLQKSLPGRCQNLA